ncbi:MAG TPA: HEAT repeat domain-containing protein [Gemmataceae bacterium]|nr:HEAT repeat domain-containing protein [Gemmataceae bacterium]
MSIPVLIQTYDEVRRLAIAGSVVAPGDFRLQKLLPQLEQAGRKAPVFAKVGEAVKRLVESNEMTSAAALLELTALVNAILYTQGETGIDGELAPLKTIAYGRLKTQVSARVLKPLQEALTTTGSGRLEIIRDAHERGAFQDFRLLAPALAALDDAYAEIGDFIAYTILPLYGQAILSELQAKFDTKGRAGHQRRLLLMYCLDPESARPYVLRALDEGSQEMRGTAISCLGDSPDDLPFLLEQVKARAKEVRSAALKALGKSGADEAVKVLRDAIASADLALAIEPLRLSRNPVVTAALLEAAEKQSDALLAGKEKDDKKLGQQNERMRLLLDCLRERADEKTEELLLRMFEHMDQLAAIKGEPSGKDVVERLVTIMVDGSPNVQSALVDAHETLPADGLEQAFAAACRCRKPAEVFTLFSPYLTARVNEKKKNRDRAYAKREAIIEMLSHRRGSWYRSPVELVEADKLDPQWLNLAVQLGRSDLVQSLAVPGHAGANALLNKLFREQLGKAEKEHELIEILDTMIRVGHPEATDAAIAMIKKCAKPKYYYGYFFWLGRLIPRLPKAEALPKLEALLPTLPEKAIDQLLGYVTELKQSTPTDSSP